MRFQANNITTASFPSLDNDGPYGRVSCVGEEGYSVLRRPVAFNANANPAFNTPMALDNNKKRELDDANMLYFEESIAGWDEDKQILKRGGGNGSGSTERHATHQMEEDQSVVMH